MLNAARELASAAFRAANPHAPGPALRQARAQHLGPVPAARSGRALHRVHPWRLLAAQRKDQFANLIAGPHARGWSAALPGYTLAPDASLTEIVAEINAALDWLAAHGPAHGINGPVVLSGWSAGGHLTAMCLGHPLVKAGLAISGVFELGPVRDTYLNEKLRLTEQEVVTLSPMRLPPVNKPLAFAYGTAELPPLVSDSQDLHALRSAAHLPGALIPVPRANHFTIVHELRDQDGMLTRHLPLLLAEP